MSAFCNGEYKNDFGDSFPIDTNKEIKITLVEPFNSNLHPTFATNRKSFMLTKGEVEIDLILPKQVYILGENLKFAFQIRNSTQKEIQNFTAVLKTSYIFKTGDKNFSTYKHELPGQFSNYYFIFIFLINK